MGWWLVGLALAQEAPSPEPNEAGELYRVAVDSVFEGDFDHACDVFGRVVTDYPGTDEAARATEQLGRIARCRGEPPEKSGAVELVVSQAIIAPPVATFVPLSLGVFHDFGTPVAFYVVGLGGSIGATSAIAKRWQPTQGQAMAVYTGELVGFGHGLAVSVETDPQTILQTGAGGAILGGLAGAMVAVQLRPSAGDMALIRSGGTWGLYGMAVSRVIAPTVDGDEQARRAVLFGDAGLLVGLGLATLGPDVSRQRVNHVNIGGYMGILGAVAVRTALVQVSDFESPEGTGALLAAGGAVGLAAGVYATSDAARVRFGEGGGRGERLEVLPLAPWRAPDGALGVQGGFGGRF